MYLNNDLILCVQITRQRVDFNGDCAVKSPFWRQVLNLQPSIYSDLFCLAAIPSVLDLDIFMASHGWAGTSGQCSGRATFQQSPPSCPEQSTYFPRTLKEFATHLSWRSCQKPLLARDSNEHVMFELNSLFDIKKTTIESSQTRTAI